MQSENNAKLNIFKNKDITLNDIHSIYNKSIIYTKKESLDKNKF